MNIANLFVRVSADVADLERKMSAAQKSIAKTGQVVEDLGKKLSLRVTAPLTALGVIAVRSATQLDSLRRGLTAVAGSGAEAERQLGRLADVARLPGLGFREAIEGSINLQAVGFAASDAERALRAFGNAIATTGGGGAELDRVITQLTQMASAGRILTADLRPIIQLSPLVGRALQEAFGTINAQDIEALGLSFDEFFDRLVTQLEALPQVSGGAQSGFENLQDAAFRASATLGEKLLPAVLPLAEGLANLSERLSEVNPNLIKWGIAIGAVAAAAGPLTLALGSLTTTATALAAAFSTSLLPVVAVGAPLLAGLAALSALFIKTKLDALEAASAVESYSESLRKMSGEQLLATEQQLLEKRREVWEQIDRLSKGRGNENRINALKEQWTTLGESLEQVRARMVEVTTLPGVTVRALARPLDEASDAAERLADQLERIDKATRGSRIEITTLGTEGVQLTPEARARFEAARDRRNRFLASGGTLEAVAPRSQRMPLAMPSWLEQTFRSLRDQVRGLASSFGPLAASVAILKPVFDGFRTAIEPALTALTEPLRQVGQVIGGVVGPILDALTPPLQELSNLFGVLVEPLRASVGVLMSSFRPALELIGKVARVVGVAFSYVNEAIGWFIRAIGRAIDALVPDWFPLIGGAGKGLQELGQDLIDSARAVRNGKETVEEFESAVSRATASLVNYARVTHINALRFGVLAGMGAPPPSSSGPGPLPSQWNIPKPHGVRPLGITINTQTGAEVLVEEGGRVAQRLVARGGTSRFALETT